MNYQYLCLGIVATNPTADSKCNNLQFKYCKQILTACEYLLCLNFGFSIIYE